MVYKITKIKSHIYSSNYGNNKVFGQPKNLRSGVILEIQTKNNLSGYGETYLAGYLPELTKESFDSSLQTFWDDWSQLVEDPYYISPPLGETYCFCPVRLPVRQSVCPSVTLCFHSITGEPFDPESSNFI